MGQENCGNRRKPFRSPATSGRRRRVKGQRRHSQHSRILTTTYMTSGNLPPAGREKPWKAYGKWRKEKATQARVNNDLRSACCHVRTRQRMGEQGGGQADDKAKVNATRRLKGLEGRWGKQEEEAGGRKGTLCLKGRREEGQGRCWQAGLGGACGAGWTICRQDRHGGHVPLPSGRRSTLAGARAHSTFSSTRGSILRDHPGERATLCHYRHIGPSVGMTPCARLARQHASSKQRTGGGRHRPGMAGGTGRTASGIRRAGRTVWTGKVGSLTFHSHTTLHTPHRTQL